MIQHAGQTHAKPGSHDDGPRPDGPQIHRRRRHKRRGGGPQDGQDARAVQHHGDGYRRHHRGGDLRPDGHGGGAIRRAGHHPVLRAGRNRLRFRRAVLRRTGGDAARQRQHLHLHLCNARRGLRLDHRLGPDPGVRHGRVHGCRRVVRLRRQPAAQRRDHLPPCPCGCPLDGGQTAGWRHRRRDCQPARGVHRTGADGPAGFRHQGIGPPQQHHGRHQAHRRHRVHRRRSFLHRSSALASVHPRQHGRVRPFRLERHSPRFRRGVLRLPRLRLRVHGGAGGQQSPTRHADRHHGVAGDLHSAVHHGCRRADGTGALRTARCRRPYREGGGRHRGSRGSRSP